MLPRPAWKVTDHLELAFASWLAFALCVTYAFDCGEQSWQSVCLPCQACRPCQKGWRTYVKTPHMHPKDKWSLLTAHWWLWFAPHSQVHVQISACRFCQVNQTLAGTSTIRLYVPATLHPAGLVRSAAATYVNSGVRVNAVAPGLTRTRQTENMTKGGTPATTSAATHPVRHFAGAPAFCKRLSRHKQSWDQERTWGTRQRMHGNIACLMCLGSSLHLCDSKACSSA